MGPCFGRWLMTVLRLDYEASNLGAHARRLPLRRSESSS